MNFITKLKITGFILALAATYNASAQIPGSATSADPGIVSITLQGPSDASPLGTTITTSGILKVRVNNPSSSAITGNIPPFALDYTVQFNPFYTYQSLVPSDYFQVVSASSGSPDYVVHLTNKVTLPSGFNDAFYLNVMAYQQTPAAGAVVTANVDRTLPLQTADAQVANNNVAKSFGTASPAPLPVTLSDFSVSKNHCDAKLVWISASEINTSHFDVEVSNNGIEYTKEGTVKAAGNSKTVQQYSFPYAMKTGYEYFFRLKMVDLNGSFTYSAVRKMSCNDKDQAAVLVAPNPVATTVTVSGMSEGTNTITVIDVNGNTVQSLISKDREASIDLTLFAPGVYTVKIDSEKGETTIKKVVKK